MSDLKPEVVEPDPAATSIANDETVNKPKEDASAPTDVAAIVKDIKANPEDKEDTNANSESVETNGAGKVDFKHEKSETNGKKPYRGEKKHYNDEQAYKPYSSRKFNKFDPTAVAPTDDPSKIRAQV
jgi:lupus La protein